MKNITVLLRSKKKTILILAGIMLTAIILLQFREVRILKDKIGFDEQVRLSELKIHLQDLNFSLKEKSFLDKSGLMLYKGEVSSDCNKAVELLKTFVLDEYYIRINKNIDEYAKIISNNDYWKRQVELKSEIIKDSNKIIGFYRFVQQQCGVSTLKWYKNLNDRKFTRGLSSYFKR